MDFVQMTRDETINRLLTIREQMELLSKSGMETKMRIKELGTLIKFFNIFYKRLSLIDQSEYHYQYCKSLGMNHSMNRIYDDKKRNT